MDLTMARDPVHYARCPRCHRTCAFRCGSGNDVSACALRTRRI